MTFLNIETNCKTDLRIYKKKFLHSDWLRAVQFFLKQCRKVWKAITFLCGHSLLHDVVSPLCDVVSSLCDVVSPLRGVVSSLYDGVSPLRDVVLSLCVVVSPLCGVVLSLCDLDLLQASEVGQAGEVS